MMSEKRDGNLKRSASPEDESRKHRSRSRHHGSHGHSRREHDKHGHREHHHREHHHREHHHRERDSQHVVQIQTPAPENARSDLSTRTSTTPGKSLLEKDEIDMTADELKRNEMYGKSKDDKFDMKLAMEVTKDGTFENDLDYMDDNAQRLGETKRKQKDVNVKNSLEAKTKRLDDAVENCSLCIESAKSENVTILAMGTRAYLALAPEPALYSNIAVIVPIPHCRNTLECDDDEWTEIRNFMKSLIRMWDSRGKGVIFYENAVGKESWRHAVIYAMPLPHRLVDDARGYFSEAISEYTDEWSANRRIIDTDKRAGEMGSNAAYAFRTSISKEAPYFHVWTGINGGIGHITEDTNSWPPNEQFAKQVVAGMLHLDPLKCRQKSQWKNNPDAAAKFLSLYKSFDWTGALD